MMKRAIAALTAAVIVVHADGCAHQKGTVPSDPGMNMAATAPNTLSAAEQKAGWRLLFDGTSLKNFRDYKADTLSHAWTVVDGVITKTHGGVEDMVTRESFGDFEFSWDWKLSLGGNSGVFYRATEEYDKIYWSGTEFQLLDDSLASDNRDSTHLAGSAYGLWAPIRGVAHVGGNWNTSRIVARGSHIEHWMNGRKVVEYEAWSPEWKARVAKSKFHSYPNYGLARSGLIGFQGDHDGTLELRNIKIRVLQ